MAHVQGGGTVSLGDIEIGQANPFVLISGPCVIESEEHCLELAHRLTEITGRLQIPLVFKASYDKANRTSLRSFRGPGLEKGLYTLEKVRSELALPVLTDVHTVDEAFQAGEVVDVIQVPAFLCRQTDLIVAAAETGCVVNLKKGQFLAPWDIAHALEKARSTGNSRVLLTERGAAFGYNNLVVDFKSLPIMRALGAPVIFDATHSVQLPGSAGSASGGQAEFIAHLARAAVAVGVDGLFLEVHETPERALSDGANALQVDLLEDMLKFLKEMDRLVKTAS